MKENNKNRNGFGIHIVIVFFALVFDRSEIIQYSDRGIGQAHIIPQLLTLFDAQRSNGFTLYSDIPFAKEIDKMPMFQRMAMIRHLKIIFLYEWYLFLLKRHLQGFLINIFIQPRPQFFVNILATTDNVVNVRFQLR